MATTVSCRDSSSMPHRVRVAVQKLLAKVRWHLNHRIRHLLPVLSWLKVRVTVTNAFGSPGDLLMTATLVSNLKRQFPGLRINLVSANSDIVAHDPHLESINGPESFFAIRFWYLNILLAKDGNKHALEDACRLTGLTEVDRRAAVFLTSEETAWARTLASEHSRPVITINVMSRELVKVWPVAYWKVLVAELTKDYSVVQLGGDDEPELDGVHRLAGRLSFRQSMAFLSQSTLHIGPDSFLMHAANGVGVWSVIIYGGSRTPENAGYSGNSNLFRKMECGPCYIHTSRGQRCEHDVKCMREISPQEVLAAVQEKQRQDSRMLLTVANAS